MDKQGHFKLNSIEYKNNLVYLKNISTYKSYTNELTTILKNAERYINQLELKKCDMFYDEDHN